MRTVLLLYLSVDARDFPVEERVVSVFKIFTRRCCIDSHYKIKMLSISMKKLFYLDPFLIPAPSI